MLLFFKVRGVFYKSFGTFFGDICKYLFVGVLFSSIFEVLVRALLFGAYSFFEFIGIFRLRVGLGYGVEVLFRVWSLARGWGRVVS